MARILSGIQPSGQLHLGNYAGAIRQFIDYQDEHELFIFVASYHAMTSTHDAATLAGNIKQVVVDYLAFGLDPAKANIYLQQDVPEVTELAWIIGCVCPKGFMDKGTSYKDKTEKGIDANIGLYTYPILQAADILSVDPDWVPVGEDQRQHVEICRDLAGRFNARYGDVFKLPELRLREGATVLPGIDGQKMSKSYGNTIDPFMDEKPLRKRIMKIKTDSTPLENPKDPETCPVYQIVRAIAGATDERTTDLAKRYRDGGMGYGEAKQALFELILDHFAAARARRAKLVDDTATINAVLDAGAKTARDRVAAVVARAREAVGLGRTW